ncbi:DUF6220 domain-containing protein [Phytohabitans houttuyneae]|jgi:hypothetical protein|uniref:Uncharacterized protein n=1 Tax=Phytohabitans houttuyneae TaxID=1076126 RepID=A0A6V8KCV9_9ACTN|nr:DUF6220 domain-containing protein [Phytohabitans houttuyneae]GFJ78555.1 hypothetical protein Phou_027350 [Phytohabitans houttuyneae]
MRRVFVVLAGLLFLAILVQFYFAAVGAFDRPQDDDSFALHSVTGMMIIPLLSILTAVAAALARAPGRLIGMSLAPLGLVVVQVLIIVVGNVITGGSDEDTGPAGLFVLGLHAVNALFVMGAAGAVLRRARAFAAEKSTVDTPQPTVSPAA